MYSRKFVKDYSRKDTRDRVGYAYSYRPAQVPFLIILLKELAKIM